MARMTMAGTAPGGAAQSCDPQGAEKGALVHPLAAGALISAVVAFAPVPQAAAGEVDILDVVAERTAVIGDTGVWRIEVTLTHDDIDWDHYANRIEVLAPNGALLGSRVLHHPHVGEMPITRALPGVEIPLAVTRIIVRGHDSVDGYGGERIELSLQEPTEEGAAEEAASESAE